jgi:hypothetical protein
VLPGLVGQAKAAIRPSDVLAVWYERRLKAACLMNLEKVTESFASGAHSMSGVKLKDPE